MTDVSFEDVVKFKKIVQVDEPAIASRRLLEEGAAPEVVLHDIGLSTDQR